MSPDNFTIDEFYTKVGDGHRLYVHVWGNNEASIPIIYLHGGPGNGCDNRDKKKFDPKKHRVIFIDQRGSGKSLPKGELKNNSTDYLIEDIEKIRTLLNHNKIILCGGSWGSTLALCYAIKYPERVAGLVIDGVFTSSNTEIDWLNNGGWKTFYPEIWDKYIKKVPPKYKNKPTAYYFKQAESTKPDVKKDAAYEFIAMELALLKLDDIFSPDDYSKYDPNPALIEMHYLKNNCFIKNNYIINNADKIKSKVYIIQGRFDMVCPPETAYKLNDKLPDSEIIWTISGHLKQNESKNILKIALDTLLDIR